MSNLIKRINVDVTLLVIFAILISVLETLAYRNEGIFSIIAGKIWLVWGIYFFFFACRLIVSIIKEDIKDHHFFGICALLFITFLSVIKLGSFPLTISGEGSIELNAALDNIKSESIGYTKNAFLGTMNRQYLITSLPSYFWGRTIISYRLGTVFVFLLGVYLLYAGIRTYYKKYLYIERLAGLMVLSILSIPIMTVILRIFDAVILPVSFTMQTVGILLIILKKPKPVSILAFMWILNLLATVYAPSVASWSLITLFIFIISVQALIRKNNIKFALWLICALTTAVFFASALLVRQDIRLKGMDKISNETRLNKTVESLEYFFLKNTNMYDQHVPFMGSLMFTPIVVYLVGSLLLFGGYRHLVFAVWVMGTIVVSGLSPGFASPPVWYGIHRSLIIFPFLLIAIIDIIASSKFKITGKLLVLLSIVFIVFDIYTFLDIYQTSQKNYDFRALGIRETIQTAKKYNIPSDAPLLIGNFTNLRHFELFPDALKYFFPNTTTLPNNICPSELKLSKEVYFNNIKHGLDNAPIILYADKNNDCYKSIMKLLEKRTVIQSGVEFEKETYENSTATTSGNIIKIITR